MHHIVSIFSIACFISLSIPTLGQLPFSDPYIYNLHYSPHKIAFSEIKNNVHPDIIVMYSSEVLHWGLLENVAEGEYNDEILYTKESNYVQFDAGDVNHDGHYDMVISSYWNNGFKIFLSDGMGTFGTGKYYMAGVHGRGVKIVDIDQDGFNDILAITTGSSQPIVLHVYKGNGSGSFNEKKSYPSVLSTNRDTFIADKNGDGLLDVIISTSFNWIAIYYQQTDGSFICRYVPTETTAGVLLTKINNDDIPDLVLNYSSFDNTPGSDSLIVRLGMKDTLFSNNIKSVFTNIRANDMISVDYNQDGWNDLVSIQMDTLGYNTDTLIFMQGDGSGFFQKVKYLTTPSAIRNFIWGDVNGDNKPDLLVAMDNYIAIYKNDHQVLGTEDEKIFAVTISPNPASKMVNISTPDRQMQVVIYTANGNSIYTGLAADKHYITVSGLSKGVYFIRIFDSKECTIRKLLIE